MESQQPNSGTAKYIIGLIILGLVIIGVSLAWGRHTPSDYGANPDQNAVSNESVASTTEKLP